MFPSSKSVIGVTTTMDVVETKSDLRGFTGGPFTCSFRTTEIFPSVRRMILSLMVSLGI